MHESEPPRIPLAELPTPLVEMHNLARHLDINHFLLKRDDLTGLETTGNKVRKLEYVIADAINQGADTLVTHGGFQSNHCRATAAIGARLGLRVRLLLRSPGQNPPNDGNLFLDRILGAHVTLHSPDDYNQNRKKLIDQAMAAEREEGRRPYFFPVGASTPLGCWGYIRCMHELVEQLGKDRKVDVFCAVSSSGTFAGLMIGRALFTSNNWRIIGIPVSDSVDYFKKDLRDLERRTNAEYQLGLDEAQTPVELIDGFIGEGYAIPYPAALETVKLLARLEGILFDPTYTAKAMHGAITTIQRGALRTGALPIFIHTGGIFGLLARRDLFS